MRETGKFGVLDDVVEQRGGQRGRVHAHVGKNMGDFQQVGEIGIAGAAKLVAIGSFSSDVVGAPNQPGIVGGAIGFQLVKEFGQTSVELPFSAITVELQRQMGRA